MAATARDELHDLLSEAEYAILTHIAGLFRTAGIVRRVTQGKVSVLDPNTDVNKLQITAAEKARIIELRTIHGILEPEIWSIFEDVCGSLWKGVTDVSLSQIGEDILKPINGSADELIDGSESGRLTATRMLRMASSKQAQTAAAYGAIRAALWRVSGALRIYTSMVNTGHITQISDTMIRAKHRAEKAEKLLVASSGKAATAPIYLKA